MTVSPAPELQRKMARVRFAGRLHKMPNARIDPQYCLRGYFLNVVIMVGGIDLTVHG
jgi:hypothetical protein